MKININNNKTDKNMEEKYIEQAIKIVKNKHPHHQVITEIKEFIDTDAIILKCVNNNLIAYTYGYVVYNGKLCSTHKYETIKYNK